MCVCKYDQTRFPMEASAHSVVYSLLVEQFGRLIFFSSKLCRLAFHISSNDLFFVNET